MRIDLEFSSLYTNIDGLSLQIFDDGTVVFDCPEWSEFEIPVATLQKIVFRTHVFMKERSDYINGIIK